MESSAVRPVVALDTVQPVVGSNTRAFRTFLSKRWKNISVRPMKLSIQDLRFTTETGKIWINHVWLTFFLKTKCYLNPFSLTETLRERERWGRVLCFVLIWNVNEISSAASSQCPSKLKWNLQDMQRHNTDTYSVWHRLSVSGVQMRYSSSMCMCVCVRVCWVAVSRGYFRRRSRRVRMIALQNWCGFLKQKQWHMHPQRPIMS